MPEIKASNLFNTVRLPYDNGLHTDPEDITTPLEVLQYTLWCQSFTNSKYKQYKDINEECIIMSHFRPKQQNYVL